MYPQTALPKALQMFSEVTLPMLLLAFFLSPSASLMSLSSTALPLGHTHTHTSTHTYFSGDHYRALSQHVPLLQCEAEGVCHGV